MKISSVVPVYNNEKTVKHVLDVILSSEAIDELVVVDDGSKDRSVEIIKEFEDKKRCRILLNKRNRGKGFTVVRGIKASSGEIIMMCDADLANLRKNHLEDMVQEFKTNNYDMVISANEEGIFRYFFRKVSGERIFYKKTVEPYFQMIAKVGNGIEQVVNFAHKRKKVKMIYAKNIGHILKYQRGGIVCIWEYLKEGWQLVFTTIILRLPVR